MGRWSAVLAATLVAGCQFDGSGVPILGAIDADPSAPDARPVIDGQPPFDGDPSIVDAMPCVLWSSNFVTTCALPMSSQDLHLTVVGTWTFDTDNPAMMNGPGGEQFSVTTIDEVQTGVETALVIVTDKFRIDVNVDLEVTGSRPLIVAAWSDIVISGALLVNSDATRSGPGANSAACLDAVVGVPNAAGSGGGGGGSFGATGGRGGGGMSNPTTGGTAGGVLALPTVIHGGCNGARGGGVPVTNAGKGGAGGGAVLLAAFGSVQVSGLVHAGGGGGRLGVGNTEAGGGGGGSGGFIVLESDNVWIASGGVLAANGGGGSEGNDDNDIGDIGESGRIDATLAKGGKGGANEGGDGGDGGAGSVLGGELGQTKQDGGGGGGGAVGHILLRSSALINEAALITPDPTIQ